MRQLHLFKGKRQRGIEPPPPTENEMHVELIKYVRQWISDGWVFNHFANGEKRDLLTAVRLKRMGVTKGFPDLAFFGPGRTAVFLELKRPGGRLSDEQQAIAFALMKCGFHYHCAYDLTDALGTLKDFGVVRVRVHA